MRYARFSEVRWRCTRFEPYFNSEVTLTSRMSMHFVDIYLPPADFSPFLDYGNVHFRSAFCDDLAQLEHA